MCVFECVCVCACVHVFECVRVCVRLVSITTVGTIKMFPFRIRATTVKHYGQ